MAIIHAWAVVHATLPCLAGWGIEGSTQTTQTMEGLMHTTIISHTVNIYKNPSLCGKLLCMERYYIHVAFPFMPQKLELHVRSYLFTGLTRGEVYCDEQ